MVGSVGPLGFLGRPHHCLGYKPRIPTSHNEGGVHSEWCQMMDVVVVDRTAGLTNTFISAIRHIK
jgi:hypothetical protein